MNPIHIAPSIIAADALAIGAAAAQVQGAGADALHLDVMDGNFVPNITLGPWIVQALSRATSLPLDVHLMVDDNDFYVELLSKMGVDRISVHVESCTHLDRTLARIREIGAQVGAAINPGTSLDAIEYVLERLDYVLVMTVNPGYAGQKMTPASIRKIGDCREFLAMHGYPAMPIQVDGNVSFENVPEMVAAGATNLVAGTSSIFRRGGSIAENMAQLRAAIERGLALA